MKRLIELNYNPKSEIVSIQFEESGRVNFRITRTLANGRVSLSHCAPFLLTAQKRLLNEISIMRGGRNVVSEDEPEIKEEDDF